MTDILNIALENKDVFATLIILPMLWYFIKQQNSTTKSLLTEIKDMNTNFASHTEEDRETGSKLDLTLQEINNSLKSHDEHSAKQFEFMKSNIWTKQIDKADAVLMIKKSVLSGSYKKLDYIDKRLSKNNLKERKDVIKRQLRVELLKLSDEEYLTFLDWFQYNWTKLWDYVRENFPFDEFLEEIYDCIFDEHTKDNQIKLKNVLETMKVYQNEMIEKIKTLM